VTLSAFAFFVIRRSLKISFVIPGEGDPSARRVRDSFALSRAALFRVSATLRPE
jgi:hypothetical protein